ncbi:zf-ZPR1-domain-containing protein [Rickenella mellea]|uniref:Zf-ZPR1-domain-containing protein n=1 Tax=Rickenella mellea TaxID=50990 RepID=A0A4Y7QI11_9AGAM|nr:zf-ZPR1-domain-containing protein [Rickenella mellea]
MQQDLFPSIGSVAQKAENAPLTTGGDGDEKMLEEIESLCMKCGENGITRLLLTSIPYFGEVVLMSFRCEHCGTQNNEIQSAGPVRESGIIYTARILSRDDLNRQLVKSPTCTVVIPEYDLTIPASKGQLTTVEGLIRDVVSDLSADQPLRRIQDESAFLKIQFLIDSFKTILGDDDENSSGEKEAPPMPPFTVKLDDPAGNSFIEFIGSMADPKWNMRKYPRTRQQNVDLGIAAPDSEPREHEAATALPSKEAVEERLSGGDGNDEIFVFPGICSSCGSPLDTMMKRVSIPYFKDILIMSTNCDKCGYRDNEVKSGSAISEKGKRITLKVEDREDLSRDILKSETCGFSIPEIDLVLQEGTLGGRFTTLEGILEQVYEELSDKVFASGDSATKDQKAFEKFLSDLKTIKAAERPFTVILEDPLANSYVQNLYAPDPDPNMSIELFDRTWEQNEQLGLNDIKVEGYEDDKIE